MVVEVIECQCLDDAIERKIEDSIPVVFYCNENYIKYMSVTLLSIIENTNSKFKYEIYIIMDSDIRLEDLRNLEIIIEKSENVHIKIINIRKLLDIFSGNASKSYHMSAMFRLLVMTPLFRNYNKVITMDCDMVCQRDICDLYQIDLNQKILGVSYELDAKWKIISKYPVNVRYGIYGSRDYFLKYMGIKNANNYFCSGIILWDLCKAREKNCFQDVLHTSKERSFIFPDQDLLNIFFESDTLDIGMEWNHVNYELTNYQKYLTESEKIKYEKGRKGKNVIHYAGKKPWMYEQVNEGTIFWKYAKKSPWYKEICEAQRENIVKREKNERKKRIENALFPEKSVRKEIGRFILSKIYYIKLKRNMG